MSIPDVRQLRSDEEHGCYHHKNCSQPFVGAVICFKHRSNFIITDIDRLGGAGCGHLLFQSIYQQWLVTALHALCSPEVDFVGQPPVERPTLGQSARKDENLRLTWQGKVNRVERCARADAGPGDIIDLQYGIYGTTKVGERVLSWYGFVLVIEQHPTAEERNNPVNRYKGHTGSFRYPFFRAELIADFGRLRLADFPVHYRL